MRIALASLDALPACIASWRPTALVSVHSPCSPPDLPPWTGPHLRLAFSDIEAPRLHGRAIPASVVSQSVSPSQAHVAAFLAFMQDHAEGRVLIHCVAGLGRSPALASPP